MRQAAAFFLLLLFLALAPGEGGGGGGRGLAFRFGRRSVELEKAPLSPFLFLGLETQPRSSLPIPLLGYQAFLF